MPLPQLPYKRPFFQITLAAHEIEVRFDRRSAVWLVLITQNLFNCSPCCRRTWP